MSPIPLVCIDIIENHWPTDRLTALADIVQHGFKRSDDVVIVSVTQQGRTTEQKKAMYHALATRLKEAVDLEPEDLLVSVVENTKADWTFGFGRAQFLEGDL